MTIILKEEYSSGGKQFIFVLLWSAVLYISCAAMMSAFGNYAFIGGIIAVLVFCVFGFIVLTHYTARFTYSLKNGNLRINRMIGKRNKELEFRCCDITRTAFGAKPDGYSKPLASMKINVISKKKSMYIEYKTKDGKLSSVVIEPSEKLRRRIEKERNIIDG